MRSLRRRWVADPLARAAALAAEPALASPPAPPAPPHELVAAVAAAPKGAVPAVAAAALPCPGAAAALSAAAAARRPVAVAVLQRACAAQLLAADPAAAAGRLHSASACECSPQLGARFAQGETLEACLEQPAAEVATGQVSAFRRGVGAQGALG